LIRSKRGLITVGVLTLVLGLIIMLPARLAVHWFAPSEVAISGIQGSAWSGSASEASVAGIYLRDVRWKFAPLRLFTGALSYRLSATPVSGFVETDISVGFGGAVSLTGVSASLPLALFADVIGIRGLEGSGSFKFERVQIVDGLAVVADGTMQIADLVVPIVGLDSLGGYKAEFFTQNNGISASIEDTDGVIDLAGSLQVNTDRSYEFIAQVSAKPETPEGVRRQLRFLPPANDRGQQELRLEGIL
jgi:general secretion pathway protein N